MVKVNVPCSEKMREYFEGLINEAEHCMAVCNEARDLGFDPETTVEIPLTEDMASRVEHLVGPPGIAEVIREMKKELGRERLALEVARLVVKQVKGTDEQAMYQAIRTGLAILTEGVLVAPLEGVIDVKIKRNADGTSYADVFFAGPIRSAGGTGQALSVLIADLVRREKGLGRYNPTNDEIERYKEEMPIYKQVQHLQYTPSGDEIEIVVRGCPICINGEGTETEVSGHRDLPRVETNRVRGGACLVISEGMILKAPKILKHVDKLNIDGWDFLRKFQKDDKKKEEKNVEAPTAPPAPSLSPTSPLPAQTEALVKDCVTPEVPPEMLPVDTGPVCGDSARASAKPAARPEDEDAPDKDAKEEPGEDEEEEEEGDEDKVEEGEEDDTDSFKEEALIAKDLYDMDVQGHLASPNKKFMAEIIAGRPVFSGPSKIGGFRLRYGRARTTGLAATAIHPAVMVLLDDFLAIGTQMKIERPGKAGVITPCDTIEGPIVLLNSGDLIQLSDVKWAAKLRPEVKRVIDLGEILTAFGEFVENNQNLVPGAFSVEWWKLYAKKAMERRKKGIRFDPSDVPSPEMAFKISKTYRIPLHPEYNLFWHDVSPQDVATLSNYIKAKGTFENGTLILPKDEKGAIKDIIVDLGALHIEVEDMMIFEQYALALVKCCGLDEKLKGDILPPPEGKGIGYTCTYITRLSGIPIMPRAPTRIGGRMGRPEKAKERKMKPPPHSLFPVGKAGGSQRLILEAVKSGRIQIEVGKRKCLRCGKDTIMCRCPCGGHTVPYGEPEMREVDILNLFENAKARLGETNLPSIKGVRGVISKNHTVEALEKGILRAKHGLWVFKDGTIRVDMTDVPLTHFRPREIGMDLATAQRLGYIRDIAGNPLTNTEQLVELRVQDVIIGERCGRYFLAVSKFIDDLLIELYGMRPYYNADTMEDLIGHLIVGLAPHTSAGVLGRLIGYTKAHVGFAHPYFHAAKRRNCDGDEDSVMLLMDCLLNFSKAFLPDRRGGLMDAPLVLTPVIVPSEIDKEALNLDVGGPYPEAFYDKSMMNAHPREVECMMDLVSGRIGTPGQYEDFGFTHDTDSIEAGVLISSYKTLGKMEDKMDAQLSLARKIRAVSASDVATKVIETQLLPDMIGNLRTFSKQSFRCVSCNRKYRRITLSGKCFTCGGKLSLTVYEKSVKKYLETTKRIAERYEVSDYTKQRIALVEKAIDSLFENDKVKKVVLDDFF